MHLAQTFAPFIIRKHTKPVRNDGSLKARLINMRLAREARGHKDPGTHFFDNVRIYEQLHGRVWRRKALQHWFRHDSETYTTLFENVFSNTLSHLDALSAAGYDAMLEAETRWDAMPEKQITKFDGAFWTDEQSMPHRLIAAKQEPALLAIETTKMKEAS